MSREPDSILSLLAKQCLEDTDRWFGDTGTSKSLAYFALCLGGETGEFQNIVKKIERGSLDPRDAEVRYKLMMELTDVFVYLLNCAGLMGVDLKKSYDHVRGLNDKRFVEERKIREARRNDRSS